MSDARDNPGLPPSPNGLPAGSGATGGARESSSTTPLDIDSAIDAVAREMTESAPSGALRARVLERIERERRRTSPAIPRWAWAGAAVTVTLAVAATVWLARPVQDSGSAEGVVAERRAGQSGVRATTQPHQPIETPVSAVVRPGPTARVARPATARDTRPGARGAADDARFLPALSEIEPLKFSTVEPDPLHIADVEVAPLRAMPAIDIQSLDPGSNDIQSADAKKEK
jgi:hypothetical protein